MKYFLILTLAFSAEVSFSKPDLKKFQTDYCTYFSNGTIFQQGLWRSCCLEHDLRYWFGGTKQEELFADQALKSCVQDKAGFFLAALMYYGIRIGHYSPIKNRYKWGWGFTHKNPYEKLSKEEITQVINALKKSNFSTEFTQHFILKYNLDR